MRQIIPVTRTGTVLLPALLALGVSACVSGNKHAYHTANADISATGSHTVVVSVVDGRDPVVAGDKTPDWVGFNRGGFGNPFDVKTESGNPLAVDFATSLCTSLQGAGHSCSTVTAAPADDASSAKQALASAAGDRKLVVLLNQWKADAYSYGALAYDVEVEVLDAQGAALGAGEITGEADIGGSMWNPGKAMSKTVPVVFEQKLKELLDQPEVSAALK